MAYGIYKQIEDNFYLGIQNLKTFMKNSIQKDIRLNFFGIALSEEELIRLSQEIGSYSQKHQNIDKKAAHKV